MSENQAHDAPPSLDLEGKRALVTAGASGIGLVTARTMARAGARVHVCDIDETQLSSIARTDPRITASTADVGSSASVDRLFEDVQEKLGGLDIMVNNAGIAGPTRLLHEITDDEWRSTVDVNLTGQFYCLRRAIPLLKQTGGGSIVNMSSAAGILGMPMRAPYVAAKWAVVGVTKALAMELGEHGIRVNAICPGSVEGDRMDRVLAAESKALNLGVDVLRHNYVKHTSLRTFVSAQDVANMILFICSNHGSRISGQALSVDGHTETLMARD